MDWVSLNSAIERNRTPNFVWVRFTRRNRTQSNSIHWIVFDWVRLKFSSIGFDFLCHRYAETFVLTPRPDVMTSNSLLKTRQEKNIRVPRLPVDTRRYIRNFLRMWSHSFEVRTQVKSVEQYFPVVYLLLCTRCVLSHSGQTHDACVVPGRHNFTKENTDKCRKFHFSHKT